MMITGKSERIVCHIQEVKERGIQKQNERGLSKGSPFHGENPIENTREAMAGSRDPDFNPALKVGESCNLCQRAVWKNASKEIGKVLVCKEYLVGSWLEVCSAPQICHT